MKWKTSYPITGALSSMYCNIYFFFTNENIEVLLNMGQIYRVTD